MTDWAQGSRWSLDINKMQGHLGNDPLDSRFKAVHVGFESSHWHLNFGLLLSFFSSTSWLFLAVMEIASARIIEWWKELFHRTMHAPCITPYLIRQPLRPFRGLK
jgi:hypothetical protein